MSSGLSLPPSPSCPSCGSPLSDLGLTEADIVAWRQLVQLQIEYNLVAARKRAFGIVVGSVTPTQIPWTAGHIASLFIPSAPVWMGGDNSVQTGVGGEAGLPVATNQGIIFGPEEGDSATYLIANAVSVDVRCFELIPSQGS